MNMKRRNLVLGGSALLAGGMVGSLPTRAATQGNVIRFGQSASLSGGQAAYGRDIRDGINAAFAAASAADNSHGTRYELVTLDDGGVTNRSTQNVATLIDGGVSALIGLTSGPAAEACMPAVARSQIALLGTASGSLAIRNGANGAYHVRAGFDLEYRRMASYVKDFGMRRVGVVFVQNAAAATVAAMTQALKSLSLEPVETLAVDRNGTSFTDAANTLIAAKLDLVLFTTNAAPVAAIIDQMMAAHFAGMFYASSLAGQDLIDKLVARKQSCIMSTVVPRPNSNNLSVVNQCRQDLAALDPNIKTGVTTMEGYIAGRIAVEATRAALRAGNGEHLSRSRMKESIAGLRTDLGGYHVEFAPGVTQGSQYVDLITIDRYGKLVG